MPSQSTMPVLQFVRICECGCGQPTLICLHTLRRYGHRRGQPQRFVRGHRPGKQVQVARIQLGYRFVYAPEWATSRDGYIQEHRLVVAQSLGRKLRRGEVVHHINGDTLDNPPENLQLTTQPEHRRLHKTGRWSRRYDACVDCGKTDSRHNSHGLCNRCAERRRHHERKAA